MCAARCRLIQQAGLSKCLAMGRKAGMQDTEHDAELIRRAALIGYRETARLMGRSDKFIRCRVARYAEYADAILRERAEKRG